ncbi:hypothetical protein LCGC14_1971390 [marine sediment metagenome]|uniref:Uncharacterized protein n=1 Tax=marine sediment metagenome TaxID=412755 RepID=A0A0F9FC59_9ZZZZ
MPRQQVIDTREEITEESLLIEARERMDDSLTYEQEIPVRRSPRNPS